MKRFVVFCLILIVTVSLGVTAYYFMRDIEELVINAEPYIYVNKGDLVEIDVELKHAKIGNEVVLTSLTESVLEWNPVLNGFEAKEGGAGVIKISTKNGKIPAVHIQVSVGNGMKEAPFFIDSEEDLAKIGNDDLFVASANYVLKQDISLSGAFTPLTTSGFTGSLNGDGYTISGLNVTTAEGVNNAGLFAKIGATGVITNLTLKDVTINGEFENAGAIAGINQGTIHRCEVLDGTVASTLSGSSVGGVAGVCEYSNSNVGRIDRTYSNVSVSGSLNVGGLVGHNNGAILINSYVSLADSNKISTLANGSNVGGLVGLNSNKDSQVSTIKNCYVKGTIEDPTAKDLDAETIKLASLIGFNDEIGAESYNNIMGVYTENSILAVANHESALPTAANESKKINFRGLYSEFPKNDANEIDPALLKSFVSIQSDSESTVETWDFVNVWEIDSNLNAGYPVLNKLGADVPDNIALIKNPSVIRTAQDLFDMATDVNNGTGEKYYRLEDNIDLVGGEFIPIGTNAKPFDGYFDGNGYTISNLKVSASTIEAMGETNNKLAGLFGKITSNATVKNFTLKNVSIDAGATYAGSVVAYSEGTIDKVTITQDTLNKTTNTISASYAVGGVAGVSFGLVDNCKVVNQTINLNSSSVRFAGGIVGINGQENSSSKAIIKNSSVVTSFVYDSEQKEAFPDGFAFGKGSRDFIDALTKAVFYVGGIAGANYYEISSNYVYNSEVEIDEYSTLGVAAGVAGLSKSVLHLGQNLPEVSYNKVVGGEVRGFAAAGLVSYLYGIAQYNHIEMDRIYGLMAAGLTNDIKVNGRLNNCFVKAKLVNFTSGDYANGSAGITNYVRYQSSSILIGSANEFYGEFKTIFSACSFESTNYMNRYDSNASYRQESNFITTSRVDGYGNNLIWVETGFAGRDETNWFSDSRQNDIYGISEEEAKFMIEADKTIALFTKNGFDVEHWSFEIMNYPTILNLPVIAEIEE